MRICFRYFLGLLIVFVGVSCRSSGHGSDENGFWGKDSNGRGSVTFRKGEEDWDFQEGDLVLRCGRSVASRSVRFLDKDGIYSHIGILARQDTGWVVVHAVPGESVPAGSPEYIKAEEVESFLSPSKAEIWGVYRYEDSVVASAAAREAWRIYEKRLLFDHGYDLEDTSSMYCSELVIYSYLSQGVDLSLEKREIPFLPGLSGPVVFPSDIIRSPGVRRVCAH